MFRAISKNKYFLFMQESSPKISPPTHTVGPSAEKGLVDNYIDHAYAKLFDLVGQDKSSLESVRTISRDASNNLISGENNDQICMKKIIPLISSLCFDLMKTNFSIFDNIYDGYDYTDTIMQATIIPALKIILAVTLVLSAIIAVGMYLYFLGKQILSPKADNSHSMLDITRSLELPKQLLLSSGITLFTAVTDLANGLTGMFTRLGMTAVKGYKTATSEKADDSEADLPYRFAKY